MKQLSFVLAIALILIAVPTGDTEARLHPDGFKALDKDTGEDHPWGGESDWSLTPDPISSHDREDLMFTTGYSPLEFLVWKLIINVWIIDDPQTDIPDEENGHSETITSRN